MASDVSTIVRRLRRQGYQVSLNKTGHWRVTANGVLVTTIPGTTRDKRLIANVNAQVARFQRGTAS